MLLSPCVASAEEATPASETLFLEGKRLMQAGRTEEACEKFKASHDGDKTATGTLLNLALCNEQRGRTASAWAEFRQVAAESAAAHREDRVSLAREHEAKLFPRLSYVAVNVRNDARMSGMRIVLDEEKDITEPMWQTKLPIDPGEHTVVVDAPGRIPKSYRFTVKDTADVQSVDVLPLVVAPAPEPARPATGGSPGRRAAGYAIGAVGLAAVGTGAVFGVLAMNKDGEIRKACGDGYQCPSTAYGANKDKERDVQTFARVSDVAIGAGAILVIAGAVLVYTGRDRPAARTGMTLHPAAGPRGGSMLLEGAF